MRQQANERFHVQVDVGDDAVEMRATGEVDVATVGVLRAALWAAPARPLLRLDLSGVRLLSAAGVRALIAAHRRVRARGGELVLVDPTPMIARVLNVTGLDRVIPVRGSVDTGSPGPVPLFSTPRVPAPLVSVPAVRVLTRIASVAAGVGSSGGRDASGVPPVVLNSKAGTASKAVAPLGNCELSATPELLAGAESRVTSPKLAAPRPLARTLGSLVPVAEASSAPLLACA